MNQLLGQDAMNTTSPVLWSLGAGRCGPKTHDGSCGCGSLSKGPMVQEVALVCRAMTSSGSERSDCSIGVSPRFNSSLTRSLLRGQCDARRRCVVLLSGLLSQNRSGPLSRMHDLALGSRAHSHGFAQV
jgi:hypothetical protein